MEKQITKDSPLEDLLQQAASLVPQAVEQFYQAIFKAEFYVPTREGSLVESTDPQTGATEGKIIPGRRPQTEGLTVIGERGTEGHDFATVTVDGRRYLPFFSTESNLHAWLGPEAAFRRVALEKLVWNVKGETWLYLDPNQDFGKEFSPWEIEQLRRGPESIEDLVADQLEDTPKEVSFSQDTSLYPEFRARLCTMLDLYEEIEEAFLLSVGEENESRQNLLLGIRQTGLPDEKKAYLRDEIDFARAATLPGGVSAAVLFDLNDAKSANSKLFKGAVPFYIAQQELPDSRPAAGDSSGSIEATVSAVGGLISKLLKRKDQKE